jgi:spermidine/putrescine transport system permease protein
MMTTAAQVAAKAEADDIRSRWFLSLPALIIIFCAAIGPMFVVLLYSFLVKGDFGDVKHGEYSLDGWFGVFFQRDIFDGTLTFADAHISILWRSIWLSLATTVGTLFFGFPTAYFIATRPPERRELWLFLVTIPFWTNILIRTYAIQELIRNEGPFNSLLVYFRIVSEPIQIMFTPWAIMFGMIYVFLPLMVLPLYASMEKLDFRLVEAGYDLYATRFQVLRRVIIPLVKPGIVAGSILVFIPALGAYVTPLVLGGGKSMMLGTLIELQFGQGRNWPLGSALSITLMIIVTLALLVYVRNASKGDAPRV